MHLVGMVDEDVVFDVPLVHGAYPEQVVHDHGFRLVRPIRAVREDGDLVLRLTVQPLAGEKRPQLSVRGLDRDLDPTRVEPVQRQRIAAYAVVTSDRGLLATEYSHKTAVPGRWGMPGGGLDEGEEPAIAVLREVVEETSQQIELADLAAVQASHWIGRNPGGRVEDFHAVRLVYRGRCDSPTDPVVIDRGGTTRSARWVPLGSWTSLNWTTGWTSLLRDLL